MSKKAILFLSIVTSALIVFLIATYLIYPVIGVDSGYYMVIARELYEGKVYFHEIGVSYNPLSIVALGLPYLFDVSPDYRWHLLINILISIGSTVIFYKILNIVSNRKKVNLFLSLFLLLLNLVLDGKYVLLEPLSVLFQLFAIYFYLKYIKESGFKKIFLVGVFICLAFLSKQYGVFVLMPIGIDIIFRNRIRSLGSVIVYFSVGFVIPLLIFFCYLSFYEVDIVEFLKYVLGKGIDIDIGNGTGVGTTFFSYPMDLLYILLFNFYVLIIPVLVIKNRGNLDNYKWLFLLLPITSLSVLYFANYWHYYQYIVPFWVLLLAYLLKLDKVYKYKRIWFLTFSFSILVMAMYSILTFKGKEEKIAQQHLTAETLNEIIPEGSRVYLDGPSQSYYYLCELESINLKKIAFAFPGYFYPETIANNMKTGSFLVIPHNKRDTYIKLLGKEWIKEVLLDRKKYVILRQR